MNTPSLEPGQDTLLDLKMDELKRELATLCAPASLEGPLLARFRTTRPTVAKPRLMWLPRW
jgi:hypothetical protein